MRYDFLLEIRDDNPRDDKDMYFDKQLDQYVLKRDFPLNRLYLDEGIEQWAKTSKQFEKILWEISDDIYNFIYRNSMRSTVDIKKEIMKKDELAREVIKDAMLAQVRYYFRSGAGAIKDMHGVDIERTRALGVDRIRGNIQLSPDAIDRLNSHPLLTYMGKINSIVLRDRLK